MLITKSNKGKGETRKSDMRFVANKKEEINPEDIILNYLNVHPSSTLASIHNEFKNNDIQYSKPGIKRIVDELVSEGKIKKTEIKNKHPRFSIIDTPEFTVQRKSYAFKDQICANSRSLSMEEQEFKKIKMYHNDRYKKEVINMIMKFGMISLYTCLASYNSNTVTTKRGKSSIDKKLQDLWLRNVMSFENNLEKVRFSSMLNRFVTSMITSKEDYYADSGVDYAPKPITDNQNLKEIDNVKNAFLKLFPDWYKEFQSSEDVSKNNVDSLIRDVCINHPEYLLK